MCWCSARSLPPGMAEPGGGVLAETSDCICGSCTSHVCLHLLYSCISTGGKFTQRYFFFEGQRAGNESDGACRQGACITRMILLIIPRNWRTSDSPRAWQVETLLLHPPDSLLVLAHHPWALPAAREAEWDLQVGPASWASPFSISRWDLRPGLHCSGSPAILPSCCWEVSNSF